jgi:hypothetical protein
MRVANFVVAAGLIAGGVLVVRDAIRLGIGWGMEGPKSGFFPFWLAVIMIAACVVVLVQNVRSADRAPFIRRRALGPVLKVLGPATAFVLLIQIIGLYVAAALYMGTYMRWIGRHSWAAVVLVSIGFPVVTFLVFETWFLVPMPKGPVEAWLGY